MGKENSEETLKKLNKSFKTLVFQLSKNELQLSEKVKELRDFAHIIAHDLRSPLAVAYSFQTIIYEKMKNGEFEHEENLKLIESVMNNLTFGMKLIDEMLHYAEKGGKIELEEEFSIHEVVSLAMSNLSDTIRQTKAMISVNIAHYTLKGSVTLLASVIANLLSNAIKYTDRSISPVIDISATIRDDGLKEVQISDNAQGIPQDKLNEIFEEFVRLGEHKDEKGSGIGLTTVKRILKAHGANISVQSELGKGSVFTITFA